MRKVFWVVLLVIFLGAYGTAWAMRCNGRLVTEGASKGDVLAKCGPPDVKDVSSSKTHTGYRERTVRVNRRTWITRGASDSATKRIETWIYNMGEGRMTRVLTFEDGVLVNIESGDYGSGPNRFGPR